jgi:peptidoglycan hydrolase-like protein with peptidoglycan-binding domain
MAFMTAFALEEPSDKLTERTAAFLETAAKRAAAKQPVVTFVDKSSSPQDIIKAKRTLRFLGFYRGRTNGTYDDTLFKAILAFQQSSKLVGDATSPGAGRIGPLTKVQLLSRWERGIVALQAEKLLIIRKVDTVLAEKNLHIAHYLGEGDKNDQVKLRSRLQNHHRK